MAFPTLLVEFSPTTGPFDTPSWVDITTRVLSLEWTDGKQADLEEFAPGEATIVVSNYDRLFDPEYAAGTYYGDLNPRIPFRIRATHSAVTYDLFYGFVEDGWAQDTAPPAWSTCTVRLVDLLTLLNGYSLPSVAELEMVADAPRGLWMLDETAGITVVDSSGNGLDGTVAGGPTNTTTIETPDGGTYPAVELDGTAYAIVPTAQQYVGNVCSALIDLSGTELTDGQQLTLIEYGVDLSRSLAVPFRWGIEVVSATDKTARLFVRGSTAWTSFAYSASFSYAAPRFVASRFLAVFGPATAHYVDGVASVGTTDPAVFASSPSGCRLFGTKDGANGFVGKVALLAWNGTGVDATRIGELADAVLAPLDDLHSGAQIQWALDTIGVPSSLYDLDTGVAIMGPADTNGKDGLPFVRSIAATEQGDLYVAHHDGGKLRFRDRYASFQDTRSTVTQATFSDDGTVADSVASRVIPDTLEVEPNGVDGIINQARVSWAGGEETVDESVGSIYGPRGVSVTTEAPTPAMARGIGQWIVAHNAMPQARIKALQIDPGANHSEFPTALGTRIGDRAAYRSHPQQVGSATTKALEVLGRHHAVDDVNWLTTFYLTEAPNSGVTLFTLGTSELGDPDILAY